MKRTPAYNNLPVVIFLLVALAGAAHAQRPSSMGYDGSDKWNQSFTLYAWLPGAKGDITVKGTAANVDSSISDAWDALSSLDGAFLGHYELRKKRWTILADLFYFKLEETAQTSIGPLTFEPSQTIAEIAGAYLIGEPNPEQSVEMLGGLRYTEVGLRLTDATGNSISGDQGWVDLFVGARYKKLLSERWLFSIRGDIGGFGIGDSSDFTWNVITGFEYGLSERTALGFGWRWLDYDYDTGSGVDEFKYDVLMQGPLVGYTYRF